MTKQREYSFGEKLHEDSQLTFLFETNSKYYWDNKKDKQVRLRVAFFSCECGGVTESYITDVKLGKSKRCSSNIHKIGTTREKWGWMEDHPLYTTYRGMISRCHHESNDNYHNYGGRGISVTERWTGEDGFVNFINDMGQKPEGCSVDRINTNGNYSPDNCRWADATTQGFNKRLQSNNTSGAVGVSYDSKNDRWAAYIKKNGITMRLGRFKTFEEAVKVRRDAEIEYYGFNNNYGEVFEVATT